MEAVEQGSIPACKATHMAGVVHHKLQKHGALD